MPALRGWFVKGQVIADRVSAKVSGQLRKVFQDEKPAIVGGYAPEAQGAVVWVYDHIDAAIKDHATDLVVGVVGELAALSKEDLAEVFKFHAVSHGVIKGGDAGLDWVGSNPPKKE